MKNVRDYKNHVIDCFKSVFNVYKITFMVLFLMTLLVVLFGFDSNAIKSFVEVLCFYIVVVFTIESYIKDKTWRVIFYIVGFVFAVICHVFYTSHELVMVGIFSSLGLLSLFKIVCNSKEGIDNYLWNVLQNEMIFGIVSGIILFALLFVAFVIHSLLISNFNVDLYSRLSMLWFGVVFVPGQILCLHYIHKDIFAVVRIVIKYIVYPLVLIVTGVLYLYLIKILFTREIPSNLLYSIILWLIVVGLFVYILLYNKETGISKKVLSILPYLFIVLYFVQIYSLYLRINAYGITEVRYLGIVILLIELLALIWIMLGKFEWLKYILLVMVVCNIVSFSLPYVNMKSVSINNQVKRITNIYKEGTSFDDYSIEEKSIMSSAYWYLSRKRELDKIPAYVNVSKIRGYGDYNDERYKELNYYNDSREIPIGDYKYLVEVEMDQSFTEGIDVEHLSYSMFSLVDGIEDGIKVFLEKTMKAQKVEEKNIHFKDSSSYYIKSLDLVYDEESYKILSINMEGYLLKH